MPVYRNTKTGIEFSTPCECQGADIMPVPEAPAQEETSVKEAPKKRRMTTKK